MAGEWFAVVLSSWSDVVRRTVIFARVSTCSVGRLASSPFGGAIGFVVVDS
jgi:hypothetical protein